jgi:hypothetical protein
MMQQQNPNNSSYQSVPIDSSNKSEQKNENPQKPTSLTDQPPTQEAVVREGSKTYEAYADQYIVQAP